jgi:hypothetical protein
MMSSRKPAALVVSAQQVILDRGLQSWYLKGAATKITDELNEALITQEAGFGTLVDCLLAA